MPPGAASAALATGAELAAEDEGADEPPLIAGLAAAVPPAAFSAGAVSYTHLDVYKRQLVVHEVVHGEIFFQRIVDAVQATLLQPGKIQGRFTERLAGHRAGVDAASSHVLRAFDDRHALTKICRLRASLLARGTAANHNQIEIIVGPHDCLR